MTRLRVPKGVFRAAYTLDTRVERWTRRLRERLGLDAPLHVIAYRGFGTVARARISARVLEGFVPAPFREGADLASTLTATYRRYATRPVANAEVVLRWAGTEWTARTDLEGFLQFHVQPPVDDVPHTTWHEVTLEVLSPRYSRAHDPVTTTVRVQIVGRGARFGIISDIDDTIIVTGVARLASRAQALFLTDRLRRRAFAGVRELYSALHEGTAGTDGNPVFYVSSSPWNLHEHVEEVLRVAGVPDGPILLRDWGLSPDGFAPGGGHSHKQALLRSLLEEHVDLPFVLIGDTSQEDCVHYSAIARAHPERVKAVLFREVAAKPGRTARAQKTAEELTALGVHAAVVQTSGDAAAWAAELGLIDPSRVPIVRAAPFVE